MSPECMDIEDSVEAYVVGALDDDDARALQAHLERCRSCAARVEAARLTSHALGLAVAMESPSASLKMRVMAGALVMRASRRQSRSRRWFGAIAAALVLAAAGAMTWGAVVQYRLHALQQRNASLRAEASAGADRLAAVEASLADALNRESNLSSRSDFDTALLDVAVQPDAERVQLVGTAFAPAATAHYIWSGSRELGVLDATQLPALTDGMTYELRIVYATRTENGGSFTVDETGRGALVVQDMDATNNSGRPRVFEVSIVPTLGSTNAGRELVLQGALSD